MKTTILIPVLLFFTAPLLAITDDYSNSGTCYFITAKSGLNIRSRPDSTAAIQFSLPEGEMIFYQGKRKQAIINGKSGCWLLIQWKQRQGWAFSRYLERTPSHSNRARYDGYILRLFYSFNRKSGNGIIRFHTPENAPDHKFATITSGKRRVRAELVLPVVDHIHIYLKGRPITARIKQNLRKKKLTSFRFQLRQFKLTQKRPSKNATYFQRHFTIRLRVIRISRK